MTTETLLAEIRCEELPPAQVTALARDFPRRLLAALTAAGFADADSALARHDGGEECLLATPRRFAALLTGIRASAAATSRRRRGPALAACYDAGGAPTPALLGFMKAAGVSDRSALVEITEKGRAYIAADETSGGGALGDALAGIIENVLLAVSAPRLMRWGANEFKFIRPINGVLLLHGAAPLTGTVLGVAAAPAGAGHPALAPGALTIPGAEDYIAALRDDGQVIADINQRRQVIRAQFDGDDDAGAGALLDEVCALCEQPVVYTGGFDERFLQLPAFCVKECMIKHQRAFPVFAGGALTAAYRFVADNRPPSPAAMIRGFNTVLGARLRDVEFYIGEDMKRSPEEALAGLENIIYHRALGSQRLRVERLIKITGIIAKRLRVENREALLEAAWLCKSDLGALMIAEYPALEGLIAAHYFCAERDDIAALVRRHNDRDWRAAAEDCADADVLILAVQLEKLLGMFAAGEKPSGSKDPHGLRAAAAIAAGIFCHRGRALPLAALLSEAAAVFDESLAIDTGEIEQFICERERQRLLDKGIAASVLNAALSSPPENMADIEAKSAALSDFLQRPEAAALTEAHKRINNILRKADASRLPAFDEALLEEDAEKALAEMLLLARVKNAIAKNAGERDKYYPETLKHIAALHDSISAFFDEVLVNAEDPRLRDNRLALLRDLRDFFNIIGDLSKLSGG